MNEMEGLIREGYRRLKGRKSDKRPRSYPSDEDMACYIAGLLDSREKEKLLNDIVLGSGEEESLRNYFLLADDINDETKIKVPESVVTKIKGLVALTVDGNILDMVVEFAGNIARVVRTTGTVLTCAGEGDLLPVGIFRDSEERAESNVIEISKTVKNFVVEIKAMRVKERHINLTVYIKDRRSGKPFSGERLSLVYKDRELRSSLTEIGKVEFDNIKLRDYRLYLLRKGKSQCIAMLSLKAKEE